MLTQEQATFVAAPPECSVLVACPGSGKTFTGVRRFLSRAKLVSGVAYLSFTRVAVGEARAAAAMERDSRLLLAPNFIGTIDAFVRQHIFDPFIAALVPGASNPEVIVERSYVPKHVDVAANMLYDATRRPHKPWDIKLRAIGGNIQFALNNNAQLPAGISAEQIRRAKRRCLEAGFVTHNDVLMWSLAIVSSERLRAAEIIAARFQEIIVDEAQDTSALQQEILRQLEQRGSQLSYIGDPLQSIYTFNDADPAILAEERGQRHYALTMNKRSSSQITTLVGAVYRTTMNSEFSTIFGALGVAVMVGSGRGCMQQFQDLVIAAGIPFEDAAIVVRSNELRNELSGTLDPRSPFSLALKRLVLAVIAMRSGDIGEAARLCLDFLRSVMQIRTASDEERAEWEGRAWIFLREQLPDFADEPVQEWLDKLRSSLVECGERYGVEVAHNLRARLQQRGIAVERASEMFNANRPAISVRTIHGVKGESIDAVLLFGTAQHHSAWLEGRRNENGLLGYVGLTRARRLLALGCPNEQIARQWRGHLQEWQACVAVP